jgi:hypothetical protein
MPGPEMRRALLQVQFVQFPTPERHRLMEGMRP